ncbi:MAG: Nif3-like dinuclear metal center hexameric protein, partial [Nocardioidaceae bacterium]
MTLSLAEVTCLLDGWYDPRWAEPWDAVGLVCGDPEQPVRRVLLAVDPSPAVVAEAHSWGADLVVCHHPLMLTPVHGVAATTPKGRVVHDLGRAGTALFTAHTNADVPLDGVNEALARAVGVLDATVLGSDRGSTRDPAAEPMDKLVVFVPVEHAEAVREALACAGAGIVGDYADCSFTSLGEGRFRPQAGADPAVGRVGAATLVTEARIEMVAPRRLRREVLAAMRAAHPYEEVAHDVLELAASPGPALVRGHG